LPCSSFRPLPQPFLDFNDEFLSALVFILILVSVEMNTVLWTDCGAETGVFTFCFIDEFVPAAGGPGMPDSPALHTPCLRRQNLQ
jgi:hypothetical protein